MSFSRIIIEQRLADLELALKRQEELIDSQRDAIRNLRDLIARDQLSNGLATVAVPPPTHVAEVKTPLQGTAMNPSGPYAYGIVDPTTGHVNYAMPPPHSAAQMARPSPSPSASAATAPATGHALGPRIFSATQESHLDSSQDISMVSASSSAPGSTVKRMRLLEASPATLNTSRTTSAPIVQPLKRRRALDRIRQLANLFPPLAGGGAALTSPPPPPAPVVNTAPATTTPVFRPHAPAPVVQSTPTNGAASASKATKTAEPVATSTSAASAAKPVTAAPIINSSAPKGFNYNGVQSPAAAAAAQGPSFSNSSSSLVAIPSASKPAAASAAPSTTPLASTFSSSSATTLVPSSVTASTGGRAPEVVKAAAAVSPLSTGTSTAATTTKPSSEASLATRPTPTPATPSASNGHSETLTKSVSASALSTASSLSSLQVIAAVDVDAPAAKAAVTPSKIVVQMDELSLGRSNTTGALRAKVEFVRNLHSCLQPTGTSVAELLQTHGAKKILLSWLKRLEEEWEELPVEGIMLLELSLNLFATEASFTAQEVLDNRIDKLLRRVYKKYSHQKLSLGDALLERIRTMWATYRSLYKDAAGDDAAD